MAIERGSFDFANDLVEAARLHGENSDPDHEVGDLQDLFFACWRVMSPAQRTHIFEDETVKDLFENPEFENLLDQP